MKVLFVVTVLLFISANVYADKLIPVAETKLGKIYIIKSSIKKTTDNGRLSEIRYNYNAEGVSEYSKKSGIKKLKFSKHLHVFYCNNRTQSELMVGFYRANGSEIINLISDDEERKPVEIKPGTWFDEAYNVLCTAAP